MEEVAKHMDSTVGMCIKQAMHVLWFEKGDILDERISEMEKGIKYKVTLKNLL